MLLMELTGNTQSVTSQMQFYINFFFLEYLIMIQ